MKTKNRYNDNFKMQREYNCQFRIKILKKQSKRTRVNLKYFQVNKDNLLLTDLS